MTTAESSSRIDLPGRLARRLLPLTVAIGVLIGVVAPALVLHFQLRAVRGDAEIHARELSAHLHGIMLETGALWRYHAQKYLGTLATFLPDKNVRKIVVTDDRGAELPALAYDAADDGHWWARLPARGSAPVVFNNRVVATVAIDVSTAQAARNALALLAVLGVSGAVVAMFVFSFPVSIARRLDRQVQDEVDARAALHLAAERHLAQTRQLSVVCRGIAATLERRETGARAIEGAATLFGAASARLWEQGGTTPLPGVMAGPTASDGEAALVATAITAHEPQCRPLTCGGHRFIVPLVVRDRCTQALDLTIARSLSEAEAELVTLFASKVAIALANSELHEATRRAVVALEARNAELDSFVHTVSHDLKAPLVSIHGFAEALAEAVGTDASSAVIRYVERITSNVVRMEQLLVDMLELARIGRSGRPPEAVAVEPIVRGILDDLQGEIAARGVAVTVGELGDVWGVPSEVRSVFQNLLANAVKYLGDTAAPRIEVGRTDLPQGTTEYFVRDNGIGIDPAYHDKVFQIFERLEDVPVPGSGVGLAIVQRVVAHAGGRVRLESARGRGATFWLTWPERGADALCA